MARRPARPGQSPLGGDERSDSRERALILLYEAEAKGASPADVVESQVTRPDDLTRLLVTGVEENMERLDTVIGAHSKGWTVARMASIDRTVLRIGAFELSCRPDVPVAVVIDEAVRLAKRFGTDDSGRFVNGVLSATIADLRPA